MFTWPCRADQRMQRFAPWNTLHAVPFERAGVHPFTECRTFARARSALSSRAPRTRSPRDDQAGALWLASPRARPESERFRQFGFRGKALATGTGTRARRLQHWMWRALRVALGHPNQRVIFQNADDRREFVDRGIVGERCTSIVDGAGVDLDRFQPEDEPRGVPSSSCRDVRCEPKVRGRSSRQREPFVRKNKLGTRGARRCCEPGNPESIESDEIASWSRDGAVEVWGHRRDMEQVLRAASIVCIASYREGLPGLEAAAAGRPIVATDVAGCRQLVEHDRNGLLVPLGDVSALAEALLRLAGDPEMRRHIVIWRATARRGEARRSSKRCWARFTTSFEQRDVAA